MEFVHPVLFSIGAIKVYTYGLFMAMAFMVTHKLAEMELARLKVFIDSTNILVSAIVGGIIGAKLHYVLTWNVDALFDLNTGLSFQGGLLGGAMVVCAYTKYTGEQVHRVCDALAPLLPLGHAFGILGCFFSGDGCYGGPTNVPWGMSFPNGLVPTKQFVHPAPLYEFAASVSLFVYFWLHRNPVPRYQFDNFTRAIAGMCFSRVVVELWRDHNVLVSLGPFGGLNQFQLFALLAGVVTVLLRMFFLKPLVWVKKGTESKPSKKAKKND